MSSKIKLIRALFAEGIDKIDAGNSNMTEEEENQVIEIFQTINDEKISKYQARQILNNMPASTFDKLVLDGKIPRGRKRAGWTQLYWYKKDIMKYLAKSK
jgi:hypothetical protein